MSKSWMNEYDTELGIYKYKGKKVICKTEEERKKNEKIIYTSIMITLAISSFYLYKSRD